MNEVGCMSRHYEECIKIETLYDCAQTRAEEELERLVHHLFDSYAEIKRFESGMGTASFWYDMGKGAGLKMVRYDALPPRAVTNTEHGLLQDVHIVWGFLAKYDQYLKITGRVWGHSRE